MPISQAFAFAYPFRVALWDLGALCVVLGAFVAKPLLVLTAVLGAHALSVSDAAPSALVLKGAILVARRREGGSDGDAPLPGLIAKS